MLSSAKCGLNLIPMFHPVSHTLSYCTNIPINNIKQYFQVVLFIMETLGGSNLRFNILLIEIRLLFFQFKFKNVHSCKKVLAEDNPSSYGTVTADITEPTVL